MVAGANVTGLGRRPVTLSGVRIVPELASTDRFDRVVDAVGGDVLTNALQHLNADARVVTFGAIDGTPATFDLATFGASPRATIAPLFVYQAAGVVSDDLRQLVQFVAAGRLETLAHGIH